MFGSESPVPSAPTSKKETAQIHVSFISKQVDQLISEATIRSLFSNYGEVLDVALKKSQFDKNLRIQNGYGFVHFPLTLEGVQGAIAAVNALHQVTIDRITYDCSISHALTEYVVANSIPLPRSISQGSSLSQNRHTLGSPSVGLNNLTHLSNHVDADSKDPMVSSLVAVPRFSSGNSLESMTLASRPPVAIMEDESYGSPYFPPSQHNPKVAYKLSSRRPSLRDDFDDFDDFDRRNPSNEFMAGRMKQKHQQMQQQLQQPSQQRLSVPSYYSSSGIYSHQHAYPTDSSASENSAYIRQQNHVNTVDSYQHVSSKASSQYVEHRYSDPRFLPPSRFSYENHPSGRLSNSSEPKDLHIQRDRFYHPRGPTSNPRQSSYDLAHCSVVPPHAYSMESRLFNPRADRDESFRSGLTSHLSKMSVGSELNSSAAALSSDGMNFSCFPPSTSFLEAKSFYSGSFSSSSHIIHSADNRDLPLESINIQQKALSAASSAPVNSALSDNFYCYERSNGTNAYLATAPSSAPLAGSLCSTSS
jgi:hypothetical protein